MHGGASFEVEAITEGRGDSEEIETQPHRQRHFPEEEVLAILERAGLRCLEVFGHGFDSVLCQPLDDLLHTKAVYIAGAALAFAGG